MTSKARWLVLGAAVILGAMSWPCQAAAQSIYVDYYTPQFYMDHLVFYDEAGSPVYYEGDAAYSVPSSYVAHQDLVEHYQNNADAYYRWFEQVGYANLSFRRPVAAQGYQPMYYLEYPVFYDESGQPIYYVDGVEHPVPPTYPEYASYVSHYRMRRPLYLRWFQLSGRHYRWYRRPVATGSYNPLYHDGYLVYYDDAGRPYYYLDGRMSYIPPTHGSYGLYVAHYRTHHQHYRRWYQAIGPPPPRLPSTRALTGTGRPPRWPPAPQHGRALYRTYPRRGPAGSRAGPSRIPRTTAGAGPSRIPRTSRAGAGPSGYRGARSPEPSHPGADGRPSRAIPVPRTAARAATRAEPGHRRPPEPAEGRPPEPRARAAASAVDHGGPPEGQVDCRRNPGHPACRGHGGPPPEHRAPRGAGRTPRSRAASRVHREAITRAPVATGDLNGRASTQGRARPSPPDQARHGATTTSTSVVPSGRVAK